MLFSQVLRLVRGRPDSGPKPARNFRPFAERLEDRSLLAASLYRSIDGTGNNRLHPDWGSTNEQLIRVAPAAYADSVSAPAGADRPSARDVSNALAAHVATDTA